MGTANKGTSIISMVESWIAYISKDMVGVATTSPNPISLQARSQEIYHGQSWRLESVICQCHLVAREWMDQTYLEAGF